MFQAGEGWKRRLAGVQNAGKIVGSIKWFQKPATNVSKHLVPSKMEDSKIWSQNSAKNCRKMKWSKILSSKLVTKLGNLSGPLLWHLRLPYVVNKIYKFIIWTRLFYWKLYHS